MNKIDFYRLDGCLGLLVARVVRRRDLSPSLAPKAHDVGLQGRLRESFGEVHAVVVAPAPVAASS
jgi:hypothetical protein